MNNCFSYKRMTFGACHSCCLLKLYLFKVEIIRCCAAGEHFVYKNRAENGKNNICGCRIKEIRESLAPKTSQRMLADKLQISGLDIDKNGIQRIESGQRFVTDIELKKIAEVLNVSYQDLLDK